jgi:hypothetical protein
MTEIFAIETIIIAEYILLVSLEAFEEHGE